MTPEAGAVPGVLVESRVARAGDSASAAFARAWSHSAARASFDSIAQTLQALGAAQRIRMIGVWLLTAAVVDGALTPLDPRPASAMRWLLWATCAAAGAAAALWAQPLSAAWIEWRTR